MTSPRTAGATRPWPVVAVMVLSQMLIVLDGTMLNLATTTLADPVAGLGASFRALEWIANAYTLVFASTLLAGGALADKFGPRSTLVGGMIIYAAASAAGAYASTPEQLIVARGFMGAGSGVLSPATLSIIVASTPAAVRTRAIAIWGSSAAMGVVIGPVAGGLLLSQFWWGSIFLIKVPIVALCLVGVAAVVPASRGTRRRRLDLSGLMLSILGSGALVYGVSELGQTGAWDSPRVFGPLLASLVLLVMFVVAQHRSASPSVDLRLFAQRRFAAGSLILLLAFTALAGQLFVIAFYLQGPRGLSPQTAGTVLLAAAAGGILGSQLAPAATRWLSAQLTVAVGALITVIAYVSFLWFDHQTPLRSIAVMLLIKSFGMNLIGTPLTVLMMSGVPAQLSGVGSAVVAATRQVGGTLGVAITGAILTAVYRQQLTPTLAQLPAQIREQALKSAMAAQSLADAQNLPALAEAAERSYLTAMYASASFSALTACLAFVSAIIGLYVRARHRADHHVAGQRHRRASQNARQARVRQAPTTVPVARQRDRTVRWNDDGQLAKARTPAPAVGRPSGVIRIAGVESLLLPMVALAAQDLLPGREQTTSAKTNSVAVLELIRNGEIDLAVVADYSGLPAHETDWFRSAPLVTEPLFLGLSTRHCLAGRSSIRLAELANETWVEPSTDLDGLRLSLRLACEQAGFLPNFRHFGASLAMAAELVRSGIAIAVFPAETPLPSDVVRKPLAGDPLWRRTRMLWRPDSPVAELAPEIHYRTQRRYNAFAAHQAGGLPSYQRSGRVGAMH
jgi:EmrB/QacA subfamily drug resistance transporter